MFVALRLLLAIVFVCYFGISAAKLPSIKDCKHGKHGAIDCRGMGFQNVPYDIFSVPKVHIYLRRNPLICDCSFVWFLREPSANKKRIVDYNSMKCGNSKMKGYLVKKITRESQICKTKRYKTKDYCSNWFRVWLCKKTPRIPYDILTATRPGSKVDLDNEYKCDCDTVWFIRHLRTPGAISRFYKHKNIICKLTSPNGIATRSPASDVSEARICPQKANDPCKANPCPAKVTTCKNTGNSYRCFDVNECSRKGLCKSPEVCVNKIKTGYECRCPKELVRDKASKKCVVPDPCKREVSPCPSTSKCETIRLSSGTSHRCVDIDECSTGKYKCGDKEECYNKENGYECRCVEGFTQEKGKCIAKVDPCKAKPPVCDIKTQSCVSTNWTYYECQDIDECLTQKHDCDKNAKCINTEPGFKCQCQPGFKEYNNGRKCKDLNECSNKFLCAKHARCTNLPGSYKCECNSGFFGDGKYCNDNDECKGNTKCSVDAICKNKLGTYQCICKKGYHGNGKICKDVNECSENKYECPAHSKCHNTRGSYTCKCRHGFKLKKRSCLDVDECKLNVHNCDKNALCINFVGSFKCRCKKGFEHLRDGRLCLKNEETSKSNNTLLIIVAVSATLLLIILISCCLYWQRKSKKGKENSESSEYTKMLLGNQFAKEAQKQAVFMFNPRENKMN